MKKLTIEEIKQLHNDTVASVFEDKYKTFDSVDKVNVHKILLSDGIVDFYFTVGLKFIESYLTRVTEK